MNSDEKDGRYKVTVANPGRGNRKYGMTATVERIDSEKEAYKAETDFWEKAPRIESFEDEFVPYWEMGNLKRGSEPIARVIIQGMEAFLVLHSDDSYMGIDLLKGLKFRVTFPCLSFYNNRRIYAAKIVRKSAVIRKKERLLKLKSEKIIVIKEEREQIIMVFSEFVPEARDQFTIRDSKIIFFDNRMAEIVKTLLERSIGIQWYTGIQRNTLVLPGGASDLQINKAKQVILTTDIFI